jgi:hypothetical protein
MTLAGAKQKYSNMPRALYQKVNHITRQFAKELLLDSVLNRQSSEELLNLQRALEPFIFTAISDDPFLLLEVEEAAPAAFAEILMSHYLSRKTDFLSVLRKFGIEEEPFKQKFALFERSIQKEIRESPFIPKTMNNTFAMYLNTSMQVTIQQESQVEMTQEKEIMQELQVLQKETLAPIPTECKWEEGDAFTFLKDIRERSDFSIRKNGGHLFITPLFRASICPFVSKFPFMKKFVSLFSSDILATNNFLQCEHEGSLAPSLFHRRFFPIVHLLLIDCGEETYKIVCITPTEASFWREFLNTHIQCGVWMINLEGQTIADFRRQEVLIEGTQTMRMIPAPAKENVIHLLIQVNALMGHIRFLNRYPKETTKWMQGQFEEAHTFLKYALLSQKVQEETEIFLRTPLFHSPSD